MTPVEYRVLTGDDAAEYYRIRLEALEREPTAFGSSADEHRQLTEEDFRSRLSSDPQNNFVIGVFADGRLAGTAGFYRQTGMKERHKGRIWGVWLTPELRGQGTGKILLQKVVDRAAQIAGLEQILLTVTGTQAAALAAYQALGFTSFGVEPKALKIGERYIDEEYMVLHLR